MGQLIYVVVSVIVSLLCIVFFGQEQKGGVRQHKNVFPAGKQIKRSRFFQGEP